MRKVYFALLLCIASLCGLTSCNSSSSQETINSKGGTVAFTNDTVIVKENKGLFNIPFEVTGDERDGIVKVKITIIDNDSCKEDQNFIVTSKSINISAGKKDGKVECNTVDNHEINADRTFIVKFASVDGADINPEKSSVVVKILDNDNTPYDRMAGKWTITAQNDLAEGYPRMSWNVAIETADVTDILNYGTLLYIHPFADGGGNAVNEYALPVYFRWNEATKTGSVEIKMSETIGVVDMQLEGDAEPVSYTILTYSFNGNMKGSVSTDLNTMTIPDLLIGKMCKTEGLIEVPISQAVAFGWSNMELKRRE